jgi:hypothetical protein
MADEGMYKEDAEKLAQQIETESPMVDVLDIRVDPQASGYVIIAYDNETDEEFTVDRYETWLERARDTGPSRVSQLVVTVKEKRGKKTAVIHGRWTEVPPENYPEEICDAIEEGEVPGESLLDVEPSSADAGSVEPGHGKPGEYGFDGTYLVHVGPQGSRVWKQVIKLANFTLVDQSDLVHQWRSLGFDISPQPLAPMVEPGSEEWRESDVLEEVRDRLLDISEKGYGAILLDGQTDSACYAWVLGCEMGLKVIIGWTASGGTTGSGFSGLGYSELLHYRAVTETL